jgi:hypothetical protein
MSDTLKPCPFCGEVLSLPVLVRLHAELEALRAQDYMNHHADNGYAMSGRMDTMAKLIQAKQLEIRAAVLNQSARKWTDAAVLQDQVRALLEDKADE